MSNATMNYLNSQRAIHGDDYVDDLLNSKYFPMLTSAGWRWVYVADSDFVRVTTDALDTRENS